MRLGHWPKWKSWQLLTLAAEIAILAWETALLAGYQPKECEEGGETCHALQEPISAVLYPLFWIFRWIEHNDTVVVALSGVAVAAFTFTLWLSTRALWKAGERQWRVSLRATRAAEFSARAAVMIELPILRPHGWPERYRINQSDAHEQDVLGQEITGPGERTRIPRLDFWNAGRTVAIVTRAEVGWAAAKALPPDPIYTSSASLPGGTPIHPGDSHRSVEMPHHTIILTANQLEQMAAGEISFWFFARLTYSDFMDEIHTAGFCWEWYPQRQGGPGIRHAKAPEAYTART